jgi:hypothetical protein
LDCRSTDDPEDQPPGRSVVFRKCYTSDGKNGMRLMELLVTRLMTILLYAGSVLSLPACYLPACQPPASAVEDSCPMCRAAGNGHRCSCCDKGGACTCKMSSGDENEPAPHALKPGFPRASYEVRLTLESAPFLLSTHLSSNTPFVPVLTPPPRFWPL